MKDSILKAQRIVSALGVRKTSADQMTPWDLALRMVDEIPTALFNSEVLIPGAGYGTFARALVYKGWDAAKITCVELDSAYFIVLKATMKDLNPTLVHADFLTWQSSMKFDVIIGNPPYQRPKHAEGNKDNRPLWLDFLKRGGELLNEGGWMSLLVPGQVAKSTRWDEAGKGFKALEWGNITSIKTGMEDYFNVGSLISQVTVTTGKQGLIDVNGREVDIKARPWLPLNPSPEAFAILDKISSQANQFDFKLGLGTERIDPELSIGFWRLNQNYGFTPQFSSERDLTKKMMWIGCDVSSHEDGEKLIKLLKSKLFTAFRRITFYEPNYAHLLLSRLTFPDVIPTEDSDIYKVYGLTPSEIEFVESFSK